MRDLWSTGVLSGQLLRAAGRGLVSAAVLVTAMASGGAHASTPGTPGTGQVGPSNEIYTVRFFLHQLHENNVPETTDEFELGFRVEGSINVTGVAITPPGGPAVDLVPLEGSAGVWVESEELVFDDLPSGTYGLSFQFQGGAGDSGSVFFDPPMPGGLAYVTSPVPGSSCSPLDAPFTWTSVAGFGSHLFVELSVDDDDDEAVGAELPLTATSWEPGALEAGKPYEFDVTVVQGVGSFFNTASGDPVFFGQNMMFSNTIHFTACLTRQTLTVPIAAQIEASSGITPATIGVINVETLIGGTVRATFNYALFGELDATYDFRWVNIVEDYAILPPDCTVGGLPSCGLQVEAPALLGQLPAIDPAPGTDPFDSDLPFNDPEPFYFTALQQATCSAPGFGTICEPFQSSVFADSRDCCSTHSIIYFQTLLVATSSTDPNLQPKKFCVLGGFRWIKVNESDDVFLCGETVASAELANVAMSLASAPKFPGWEAVTNCRLSTYQSAFISLGHALAGSQGAPNLTGAGTLQPGWPVSFSLSNAPPTAPSHLLIGVIPLNAPFKGGVMVPYPNIVLSGISTNGIGAITLSGTWPPGIPPGIATYYQWWIADSGGPAGFAASNAVKGTTP